jgi:hypothetical protein
MTTNKEKKQFEKWAMNQLLNIQRILLLQDHYPIELEWKEGSDSECVFCYPYKSIKILYADYLLDEWRKKNYSKVIDVLVHEMCHVITDPFVQRAYARYTTKEDVMDERERLTDHIANIIRINKVL